jgi:hypothetical protein
MQDLSFFLSLRRMVRVLLYYAGGEVNQRTMLENTDIDTDTALQPFTRKRSTAYRG